MDNVMWRDGKGSETVQNIEPVDLSWSIGLNVTLPLFDGNKRAVELAKTNIQQEKLALQKMDLENKIGLNVASKVLNLISKYSNIKFTKISSENAQKNYQLIQNNYRQGTVSVTQLIDAQKSSINARLAYSFSIYEFLMSHVELEHALGFFMEFVPESSKQVFIDKLEAIIEANK
jgi:outer membrane protein TolC